MGLDISQCKLLITKLSTKDLKIPVSIASEWRLVFTDCQKALEANREQCESFLGSDLPDNEAARALVQAAKAAVDDFRTKSKAFAAMSQKF